METMTPAAAAAALNVSKGTVYNYVKAGLLKSTRQKVGLATRIMIDAKSVADFKQKHGI